MDFFNKMLKRDDKSSKLQNEINSLQFRKESILSVVQKEITELENQKNKIFYEAGMQAYNIWNAKQESFSELQIHWEKIQTLEQELADKQEKKETMATRFDEELSLLMQDLNQAKTVLPDERACPKCGTITDVDSQFCEKCGAKLE